MEFLCTNQTKKRKAHWTGVISAVKGDRKKCEFEIRSRGHYYHVIVGTHAFGNFVCIPNWNVGCELSDFSDLFWNVERLTKCFRKTDAITVATAIKNVGNII
jgi:hypothetical protein